MVRLLKLTSIQPRTGCLKFFRFPNPCRCEPVGASPRGGPAERQRPPTHRLQLVISSMPPGTAEDDWGTPYDEKSVFSRKLFRHFSQPPYSEGVKMNEISNILHNFRKIVEILMNFHQNQYEKRRI